jgi:hypothetical protein
MNAQLLSKLDGIFLEVPDNDVPVLLGEMAKRAMARQEPSVPSLFLRDSDNHPVGYFVPQSSLRQRPYQTEEEFIKEAQYRIANPPDRFLTTDEFIALLEREIP